VGAVAAGPKTLNVIVPVGDAPPDSVPVIDDAGIAVPCAADAGTLNDTPVSATTVFDIVAPHGEDDGLLSKSPP
jgi:hypothetical protein